MKTAIVIALSLFISVIASGLASAGYDFFSYKPLLSISTPNITSAELYPPKVKEGDVLLITAKLNDVAGISYASAEIDTEAGKDRVKLHLTEGNIQSGIWRGHWIAHSTKNQKWYNLSIYAANVFGRTAVLDTQYFDPVQNHSAAEVTAGTFDAGNFAFQGNLTVGGNVNWNASNMNPTNLVSNGDFEAWSAGTSAAPDGWTAYLPSGAATAKEVSIIELGSSSAKLSCTTNNVPEINQDITTPKGINYFKNKTFTLGCWVYATVANAVRINLVAVNNHFSGYHTGDSTWQFLTVTATIPNEATSVSVQGRITYAGASSAYFDGCTAVEGSTSFAFSDKPAAEGVWSDYGTTSTVVGWAATPTVHILTKKVGNLVFVNYDITGTSNSGTTTFTVPYTSAATAGINTNGKVSQAIDNTATAKPDATTYLPSNSNIVTVYTSVYTEAAWTTSGTKTIRGQFSYFTA